MKLFAKVIFLAATLSCLSSCAFLFNEKTVPVTINSNPQGADIIIEGKNYGKTPATLTLEPKNSVALLTKEGYGSAQIKLEVWASIREGSDGARCLGDAASVIFFFDLFTQYCSDFKQKSYNVTIPYIGGTGYGSRAGGRVGFGGGNVAQPQLQQQNYQQQNYYAPYGYGAPAQQQY